jgi:hypothetical protein
MVERMNAFWGLIDPILSLGVEEKGRGEGSSK